MILSSNDGLPVAPSLSLEFELKLGGRGGGEAGGGTCGNGLGGRGACCGTGTRGLAAAAGGGLANGLFTGSFWPLIPDTVIVPL